MVLWWNIGNLALKLRDLFFGVNGILTAWKVSKCEVFSRPYFPAFGLNTERYVLSTDNNIKDNTEWYGLKSPYSPRLKEDIRLIKDWHKTMTFANKTSNMYQLTKEQ